jgi:hypothetical protein
VSAADFGPWLTAESAARYLDFTGKTPAATFRAWAKRHGIHTAHRGSRVLYAKVDLLRAIGADNRRSFHAGESLTNSTFHVIPEIGVPR